jgi:bifunctional DNA-binding transcriptional regulator/antitoxin component of YhaV-PrlF toxin-antitoxin module
MGRSTSELRRLTDGAPTVAAKIRILGSAGIPRAEIARFLDKKYQHVRNVLERENAKAVGEGKPKAEPQTALTAKVRLGPDGRIVIPAPMRAALGMKDDDIFFARLEDGEIRLATPRRTMQRVSDLLRPYLPPGVSLADELVDERHREAERDLREFKRG